MEIIDTLLEEKTIRDCLTKSDHLFLHRNVTTVDSFKNPKYRRIFEAIIETTKDSTDPDIEKIFLILPKENRLTDVGFCMEQIIINDNINLQKEYKGTK